MKETTNTMPDEQTIERNRTRYIIVGTGRSGSSLLAAILAHAGANFAMDHHKEWSRRGGAYEHPLLISAYRWYYRSQRLQDTFVPHPISEFCLNRAKKLVLQVSRQARYMKYPPATQIVHLFKSVSLFPTVIVSYRSFESYAASSYLRNGFSLNELAERYVNQYRTALLQLYLYGGCVVDYQDMVDIEKTGWIEALANLTGIEREKLLSARMELVTKPTIPTTPPDFWQTMMDFDPRPNQIYGLLCSLNNTVYSRR